MNRCIIQKIMGANAPVDYWRVFLMHGNCLQCERLNEVKYKDLKGSCVCSNCNHINSCVIIWEDGGKGMGVTSGIDLPLSDDDLWEFIK